MVDFTDLNELLVWLAGAGLSVWCVGVSDYFRNYEEGWFLNLETAARQAVVFAIMGVPPTAAYLILQFVPQEAIDAFAPHFAFIAALLSAMLVARGVFELTKRRDEYVTLESEIIDFPEAVHAEERVQAVG